MKGPMTWGMGALLGAVLATSGASALPLDSSRSVGCARSATAFPPGRTTAGEIRLARQVRTFRVHVPPSYRAGTPAPVVLMFHGGGGSGEQLELRSSRMNAVADRHGFIAVYPDGTGRIRTWNAGSCCGKAQREDVDDVGFVAALLDHLEETLCIDRRRIFASGMSNGAMMSHRLACEMSDRIAAIAPVAGVDVTTACSPSRPVPVMQIQGTADGHVPWNGGKGCGLAGVPFPSVTSSMDGWRARNGCRTTRARYLEEGDGVCRKFDGCHAGSDVVLCSIEGGGHDWPGGEPSANITRCPGDGFQSRSFSASEVMWRFFEQHPLR